MSNPVCMASIRNQYDSLTKTERRIADYVLAKGDSVVTMNVAELAAASGAAGSAVIRFCKSLGYTGFSQFRLALAMELANRPEGTLPLLDSTSSPRDAMERVFAAGVRTLQNTLSMLDMSAVERLADTLLCSDRIFLFGVGTSSPVVTDAAYRLLQLGLSASCYTDILFMSVAAMNMKKGDLAISVSHSGRTEATLHALQFAKSRGAATASITSYRNSPLAKEADFFLTAYPDDVNYPVEAVSARLAHICILDAVTVILTLRGQENTVSHLKNRDHILESIRQKADE